MWHGLSNTRTGWGYFIRDLKPSNILIATDGQPRVSDFGVAALLAGEPVTGAEADTPTDRGKGQETQLTRTGAAAGTPPTPHRRRFGDGAGPTDPCRRRLVAGRDPLRATRRPSAVFGTDGGATAGCDRRAGAAKTSSGEAELLAGLEAILLKCLSKDEAMRYPSAASLADAARRVAARSCTAEKVRPRRGRPPRPAARGGGSGGNNSPA